MEKTKNKTMNMTEGSPIRLLIAFSVPMLIGNIFQQFYNLVDSVVVGRLVSADALAAIGATGSITFMFFALCNGIGSGGGIIASQCFGRGDTSQVKSCIANTAYIMIAFPAVVGVIAFFLADPMLRLLNTPEKIFRDALSYLRLMCVGLVLVSLYNFVSSMLRALGDSKTPLYFLIFSCILNAGLDVLFVGSFGLGVTGAAVATLIAQLVSGGTCIVYAIRRNPYFHLEREDLAFNRKMVEDVVRIGLPLSLQFSLIAISSMAMQRVVNSFGAVAVAAFTAGSRIEQVIHQPYQTLSAALATYTGQNYGANRKDRILDGYRKSLLLMLIFTVLMVVVMQLFSRPITAIFIREPEVIAMGATALRITSLFYFFLGIIYVMRGVLNGLGDGFFALYNGIVEVIGRFTVPVLLTSIPLFGVWGIWWSAGIVWFLSGFTAWLRYRSHGRKILRGGAVDLI